MEFYFEFERLDVYQAAGELIDLIEEIVRQLPRGYAHRRNQLQRAGESTADNIAEGNGEVVVAERQRFFRMSRRSALESANQLLRIKRHKQADPNLLERALRLNHRIVMMLTPMAGINRGSRGT